MKLQKMIVHNFRKLKDVTISFGDATFLIGANNAGKTSTLDAIDLLLSDTKKIDISFWSKHVDVQTGDEVVEQGDILIEGVFHKVDAAILNERGFNRARLFTYQEPDGTTAYGFNYRIRCGADCKVHREIKLYQQEIKPEFENCHTPQEYINLGISASYFEDVDLDHAFMTKENKERRENIPELWDVKETDEWFENPGGITGNVLSKLPKFLMISASSLPEEINDKSGSMQQLLLGFFEEVRNQSPNYIIARDALRLLSQELDPSNNALPFGQMMAELNQVVGDVFPTSQLGVEAELTNPDSLKPSFNITMQSNVRTEVNLQGTGMIRSVVFALLKFRKRRETGNERDLIIGFEEPELFLHPNAANRMRDTIYRLAIGRTQRIATTHSPFMIDISQRSSQILNSYNSNAQDYTNVICFNHSASFEALMANEKDSVKMIQKIDDYVARVFFAKKVIVVEGDTEDVVLRHTISVMPEEVRKRIQADYQVVKARGKATMISFVKYLRAMNVDVFVIHDCDSETAGAARMNQPILDALGGDEGKRYQMVNCIEDVLGYPVPKNEKPYTAYSFVKGWAQWADVPENWKHVMRIVFADYLNLL